MILKAAVRGILHVCKDHGLEGFETNDRSRQVLAGRRMTPATHPCHCLSGRATHPS